MLACGRVMFDNQKTAKLLDDLPALDLAHRPEAATEWRTVAESFAGCLM